MQEKTERVTPWISPETILEMWKSGKAKSLHIPLPVCIRLYVQSMIESWKRSGKECFQSHAFIAKEFGITIRHVREATSQCFERTGIQGCKHRPWKLKSLHCRETPHCKQSDKHSSLHCRETQQSSLPGNPTPIESIIEVIDYNLKQTNMVEQAEPKDKTIKRLQDTQNHQLTDTKRKSGVPQNTESKNDLTDAQEVIYFAGKCNPVVAQSIVEIDKEFLINRYGKAIWHKHNIMLEGSEFTQPFKALELHALFAIQYKSVEGKYPRRPFSLPSNKFSPEFILNFRKILTAYFADDTFAVKSWGLLRTTFADKWFADSENEQVKPKLPDDIKREKLMPYRNEIQESGIASTEVDRIWIKFWNDENIPEMRQAVKDSKQKGRK